jgi:2-alkenal reductase
MFRQMHRSRATQAVLGFGIALLTFGMVSAGAVIEAASASTATPAAATTQTAVVPAVDVVARVGPAVVTVVNEQRYQMGDTNHVQPVGSGTGFVIDNDGHIVTNWHVVDGGDKFFVIFADGTKRDATLVGSDEVNDLPVDSGAYVQQVSPGSPAAAAGIQEGDIVLAIDGTKIDQQSAFTEAFFPHKPGDQVTVTLQRGDQQLTVKVTLGERSAVNSATQS